MKDMKELKNFLDNYATGYKVYSGQEFGMGQQVFLPMVAIRRVRWGRCITRGEGSCHSPCCRQGCRGEEYNYLSTACKLYAHPNNKAGGEVSDPTVACSVGATRNILFQLKVRWHYATF
jgi:hypothetical protein